MNYFLRCCTSLLNSCYAKSERRFAVSYIESQVSDKTSLVKVVHTFVTKLLSVIPSKGSTLTQCDYKVPARFLPGR
jgi:hypothetical protein